MKMNAIEETPLHAHFCISKNVRTFSSNENERALAVCRPGHSVTRGISHSMANSQLGSLPATGYPTQLGMKRPKIIFGIYVAFLVIFVGLMAYTPYLAFADEAAANSLYSGFSLTCHQKISRSQCVFANGAIGDCTNQSGVYIPDDQRVLSVEKNGVVGYKFPVCSRDVGLYLFMLIGAIIYLFIFRLDNRKVLHPAFLVLAILPLAMDGGLQFLSDVGLDLLGFPYESTNLMRMITGGIAGIAVTFYALPILNRMFN